MTHIPHTGHAQITRSRHTCCLVFLFFLYGYQEIDAEQFETVCTSAKNQN